MKGAIIGFVMGAGLVYAFLVYPAQSKAVVKAGVDTATTAIAQGATAAQKAADQQIAKNGK